MDVETASAKTIIGPSSEWRPIRNHPGSGMKRSSLGSRAMAEQAIRSKPKRRTPCCPHPHGFAWVGVLLGCRDLPPNNGTSNPGMFMLSTYSQVLRIIEKEKVQKKSKKRAKPKSRKKNCLDKKCRNKAEKKQTKVQKTSKQKREKKTNKKKKNKQKKQTKKQFFTHFSPLFLWLWNLFSHFFPTFSPLFLWLWKCQNFALSSKKSKKSAKKVRKKCKKSAKKEQKKCKNKCKKKCKKSAKKSAKKKRAQFASKKMLFFAFLFAFFCSFFCSFFAFLERCYFVFAFHARTFSALFLHFFCFPYSHRSWLTGQHKGMCCFYKENLHKRAKKNSNVINQI